MLGGASLLFPVRGEAERTENGGGFLGDGAASHLPTTYGVWRSAVSFTSVVPATKRFCCILQAPDGHSWKFFEAKFGEAWPP